MRIWFWKSTSRWLGRHNNAHRIWSQRHNLVKQELLLKIGGRIQLDPVDTGCTREIGEILEFLIDLSKFSTTCSTSRDLQLVPVHR